MSIRAELADTVRDYLMAAEQRDLDRAASYLAPDAEIVFPGGVRHPDLRSVVAAARDRYRWVSKSFDAFDVDVEAGTVVVNGHLRGENLHGVEFAGIRYIDRFRLHGGAIVLQHVWNDLEESGVLDARTPQDLPDTARATC